jgi:DNA invertase Pin-like site-specific DNA recombinase
MANYIVLTRVESSKLPTTPPRLPRAVASLMGYMTNIVEQANLKASLENLEGNLIPIRYCLYARKSSEAEEKQALSIDSQINEMIALAQRDGLNIVDVYRESHSAKDCGQRPVYNQLLQDVRGGKFNGIMTWHPDRLARNAGDLGAVVDLLDQKKLVEIRTHSQKFTNNPNEKFLLMILGSQAKLENDNKSINVKRGLKTKCELGLWPSVAPTGYLNSTNVNEKGIVYIDQQRAPIIRKMFERVAYEGVSGKKLFFWLRDEIKFKTRYGKPLTLSNVYIILKSTFYYGTFEYPRESGRWFQGKHEAIIAKELFDMVQEKIQRSIIRVTNKEFAFTKLMTCGLCGSAICADEKFKKQMNGNVHRYVYYGCSRFADKDCKCGYIREEDLIKQFEEMIETLDLDEIGMKEHIKAEVERYKKFQSGVLGIKEKISVADIEIRNYAKYILREGTNFEKRELLSCLRSKITLSEKKIFLKEN